MRETKERQRWIAFSLATAAAIHVLLLVPLIAWFVIPRGSDVVASPQAPIRPYELVLERDEPEEQTRQIVSLDAPATAEVPDRADYEDRVNRRVEEETRARDRGQPVAVALPAQPNPPPRPPRERTPASQEREARAETQDPGEERIEPANERPRLFDNQQLAAVFEPAERGSEPSLQARVEDPNREREQPPSQPRLDLAAFAPSLQSAHEFVAVPGAPSSDYLDLPQGDRDQVNSYENMYWSYWDRIKNQVRPHWRPSPVYRDRDPTGRVFGVEDRYTVLRVTLNGDGSLRHVYLERSSDLDFLDREAIRAIRAAEPFANVPEGLKDEQGLLSFRFGFYFEVSSSDFRIRREDW